MALEAAVASGFLAYRRISRKVCLAWDCRSDLPARTNAKMQEVASSLSTLEKATFGQVKSVVDMECMMENRSQVAGYSVPCQSLRALLTTEAKR